MREYFTDGRAPDPGPKLVERLQAVCPWIFLVCFRDKNANVVVYQANVDEATGQFDEKEPVIGYWLSIEPSYRQNRINRSFRHDREPFGLLDKQLAWGFTARKVGPFKAEFEFKMHDCKMKVRTDPSAKLKAKLFGRFGPTKMYVRSLYVEASERINIFNIKDNCSRLVVSGLDITNKANPRSHVHAIKGSVPDHMRGG